MSNVYPIRINIPDGSQNSGSSMPKSVNLATVMSQASSLIEKDLALLQKNAPVVDNMPDESFVEFNYDLLMGSAMRAVLSYYGEKGVKVEHKRYVGTVCDSLVANAKGMILEGFGNFTVEGLVENTFTQLHRTRQAEGLERETGLGFSITGGLGYEKDIGPEGMMAYGTMTAGATDASRVLDERQKNLEARFFDMMNGKNPNTSRILREAAAGRQISVEDALTACPPKYTVPKSSNDTYALDISATMAAVIHSFSGAALLHEETRKKLERLAADPGERERLALLRSNELMGAKELQSIEPIDMSGIASQPDADEY